MRKKKKDIDKVIDDQQKERKDQEEQIKKENEWLNNHLETKDIPAVMKKMDTDDRKLIIEFINKRREAKGLKPLLGKK